MLLHGEAMDEARRRTLGGRLGRWRAGIDRLPLIYLAVAAISIFYLGQDEHMVVHIGWYRDNMAPLTYGQWGFGTEELIKQFRNFGGNVEFRARFLTYFLLTLDHYLRFFLYQYGRIPTGFSLLYVFEAASLVLFYRTIVNVTEHKLSALLGVAFYATSIGFASGIFFMFMPGKPTTNVILITVAFLASEMWIRNRDALFIEHSPLRQLALLSTMFIGFNLDEGALFAPLIPPLLFPSLFLPSRDRAQPHGRSVLSAAVYLSPVVAFLIFVLCVVPLITEALYGYKFDFISTVLGTHDPRMHESGYGLAGRFTLGTLYQNFVAMVETSFIPRFLDHALGAGYDSAAKGLWLAAVIVALLLIGRLARDEDRRFAYRSMLLTGLFVLFSALLNGRHAPVVDGTYYGSAIAVFVSFSLALVCHAACRAGGSARRAAILLAALPIAIQIDRSVASDHHMQIAYDAMAADWYSKNFPDMRHVFAGIDSHRGVSQRELDWIWQLWQNGRLDELRTASVSPGALYLIAELRRFDQLRAGRLPSGLLGEETRQR